MAGFKRNGLKNAYLKPLTKEEINQIHLCSIKVLGKTGIVVFDKEILEMLGSAGCEIDKVKKLVKMPEKLVEDAIDKAPGMITLCGRDEDNYHTVKHFRRELITEGLIRGRKGIQEKTGIREINAKARDEVRRILKGRNENGIQR